MHRNLFNKVTISIIVSFIYWCKESTHSHRIYLYFVHFPFHAQWCSLTMALRTRSTICKAASMLMTNSHLALSPPRSAEQIQDDAEGLHVKEMFTFRCLAYISFMKFVVAFYPTAPHLSFLFCSLLLLALKLLMGFT